MARISDRPDYVKGTMGFEDLIDHEITIHSVNFFEGDFGEYVVCEVSYLGDDHRFPAQTGAKQVVANLKNVVRDGDIPVDCFVLRKGRSIVIE